MAAGRTASHLALERPVTLALPPAGARMRGALGRPIAIALLVVAQQGALAFGIARVRTVLLLAAAALAAGVWRRRRELLSGEHRVAAAGLFAASVVVALLPLLMRPAALNAFALAQSLTPVLVGWAALAWLPLSPRGAGRLSARDVERPRRRFALALALAMLALLALVHWLAVGRWALMADEASYVAQSGWLSRPGFGMAVPADLAHFFVARQKAYIGGRIFTQYTPGWPAMIALFSTVGLRWWTTVALGAATVWLTYLLGRRVHSELAGALAALLLAVQPWFVINHAGYMAHAATTVCGVAAAVLVLRGVGVSGGARAVAWVGAGLLLGIAFAVRPLTGVALGASLVLWMLARRSVGLGGAVALSLWIGAGVLLPIAGVLWYNAATTGHALTFGYQAVHGHLHDLGFGPRGYLVYDERFRLVPAAYSFTPFVALRNLAERVASAAYTVLPIGLLIPVLLVGRIYRFDWRWRTVAAFLVLPLLHFFYWYSKIRFFSELLPFAYVGIAMLLIHVARRNLRLAASLVIVTLAGSVALLTMPWRTWSEDAPWVNEGYSGWHHLLGTFDAIDRARREHGRIVVFVREGRRDFEPVLDRLYALDRDGLSGDVVVARDLGAENERLLRALPGRTPYRVVWNARSQRATVEPLKLP